MGGELGCLETMFFLPFLSVKTSTTLFVLVYDEKNHFWMERVLFYTNNISVKQERNVA